MSEHQAPEPGKAENQTAAALELLRLRGAISDLAIDEGRLKIQEQQLQIWIARYRGEAQQAQADRDEALAARALQQLGTLQPQLTGIQERLARLQEQKTAFAQQQQRILEQLNIPTIEAARALTSADSGVSWSPAPPAKQVVAPRRRRLASRPVFWFSIVAAMLVIVLAVVGIPRLPFFQAPQSSGVTQAITPTPTPEGPVFTPNGTGPSDARCQGAIGFDCYNPEQIQQAFSLNPLYRQGFDGHGQTIVILGAGHTTTLQADLQHFDQTWGLPDPDFQVLQPHGPPAPYKCPGGYDGLQFENTLDVEWSHAMAPGAKIVLIIGDNNSGISTQANCGNGSIPQDVTYALNHHLGNVISISYGGSELGDVSETAGDHAADRVYYRDADAIFQRAANQHVTVLASAGDQGATNPNDFTNPNSYWKLPNVEWPASDPYVLAVGGTSLTIGDPSGTYDGEAVWDHPDAATGGGLSSVFAEPAYQKQVPNQAMFQGKRGIPDVAFPAENFSLYESTDAGVLGKADSQLNHWDLAGGTSLSAPCWAGLIAIADQMYQQPLGFIQPALYRLGGAGMHDITIGGNTFAGVQGYQAQPGYDLVSGWGTPIADEFVPALIQTTFEMSPGCQHFHHLCTWQPPPN